MQALALLERTHRRHPADRDVLVALISIAEEQGDFAGALSHARELLVLAPGDQQLRAIIQELERRTAH